MAQCWWLYLLLCRDGRTYAGVATDVAARFAAHSSGKGAKFTRANPPVRVLGAQAFASKSEALKAEAALKKLDRPVKLAWARKCAPVASHLQPCHFANRVGLIPFGNELGDRNLARRVPRNRG